MGQAPRKVPAQVNCKMAAAARWAAPGPPKAGMRRASLDWISARRSGLASNRRAAPARLAAVLAPSLTDARREAWS